MLPPAAERPKLASALAHMAGAVEELLLAGLTTASEGTRQTLSVALQEAARHRLLRLGSTLRTVLEELGRFTSHDPAFSRKRLTFFLARAWLLSRGLAHALANEDAEQYDRLSWSPISQPLARVEVVCLGVVKRVAVGAFVAFEFRFRVVAGESPARAGGSLVWSCVFPVKPGLNVPPEGFLHLPQKQKFLPAALLERKSIVIEQAGYTPEATGGRLVLAERSTVALGAPFDAWAPYLAWSPDAARERLGQYRPGPLDLETELQEEVVLADYRVGEPEAGDAPGQTIYPITAGPLDFRAPVAAAAEGQALRERLEELRVNAGPPPPLMGLMHYERSRLVFQPLTAFRPQPDYLTISRENVNKSALLKALSFT